MINNNLLESIEKLKKDADFIQGIKEVINSWNTKEYTSDKKNESIRKAQTWVLRVLDYYVTLDMMDIEADLLRLCTDDPLSALKLSDSLNEIAIVLKQNYQYLCKEGTIYRDGLPSFKNYYMSALFLHIQSFSQGKIEYPDYFIPYMSMEFMKAGDDLLFLTKKLDYVNKIDFTVSSIQNFIDDCFKWADKINEYLNRMRAYKEIFEINRNALNSIHAECNDVVFYYTTAEKFAAAIMNYEKPSFHLKNKDSFYAILYALYESMGPLSKREQWLNAVLSSFELDKSNYSSTVKRIKDGTTEKLNKFYNKILDILGKYGA